MNGRLPKTGGLVLGLHPTSRGFGWVVFENPYTPIDWALASAKVSRDARLLKRFERLLKRYEPAVFVLEEFEGRGSLRVERIQKLCRSFLHIAATHHIETHIFDRATICGYFATVGASTRYEIAQAIADRIEALSHRIPRYRKAWLGEDPRQSIFDAAALALTYYASLDLR